ncbi:cache domain-containing protein [Roseofilum reptotaenium CS-1145]|uniref:HAMP domain-containing protein n=1 Tax=Roseofilum reptotaenium AO1-A TaxID=1925591 RepID=A0A1L9QL84_9CYAN|nr:cache domain-containing protein [Roseofilum reptotaenium]MDB9516832.1 cache domain-containing protein [Roseofilum reptotaenium CS-1145]OJJ18985.1 hypothetical protein BI308_21725 [Roseofilum reptotaenium AO1-A]
MVSLKKLIPILTVTPLMATLAFTGVLAIYNADKTVDELSRSWMKESVMQIKSQVHLNLRQPEIIYKLSLNRYQSNPSIWKNTQNLTINFYNKIRFFPSVSNIYFGSPNQEFIGVKLNENGQFTQSYSGENTDYQHITSILDRNGQRGQVLSKDSVFNPTTRPWYQAAQKTNNLVWSPVYPHFTTRQLGITAAQAVRDRQGNLVGVLGIDYFLNSLNQFLRDLPISKAAKVLIIQQDGQLIASSDPDPLTLFDPESETHLMITQSPDPMVQKIGEILIAKFSDFSLISEPQSLIFYHNGQKQLVWVEPIENHWNLHWVVVVALSESNVFHPAKKRTIYIFMILAATVGSALAVWNMHQLVVSPLLRLNTTAKQLKNRRFKPEKIADLVKRNDEIGQFSRVFEEMALLIQEQQSNLEKRIEQLSTYKTKASSSEDTENSPELNSSYWDYLKQKSQKIRRKTPLEKHD